MPQDPRPLPAHLGESFRVSAARASGVSRGRLRSRDLDRPFWGVRQRVGDRLEVRPDDTAQAAAARRRVLAYAPRLSPLAFYVGSSAALLLRLPIPVDDLTVHIGVLHPHRSPRGTGVRGHQIMPHLVSVREHEGLRIASPASVWVQLGAELGVRDLVAAGDAVVRVPRGEGGVRRNPGSALATIKQLRNAVDAGPRAGAAKLRAAWPLIRGGAMSRPEVHLRLDLADAGLPEPELDFEVRTDGGILLGISEIAYPTWRVALEYEGDHHRTDREQWNRDIDKCDAYRRAGWDVVRITRAHQYGAPGRPATAVQRVRDALLRAGWTGSGTDPSRTQAQEGTW